MRFRESHSAVVHSNILLFIVGLILLLFGLFVDPVDILKTVGFPVSKLYGERGQTDLAILRILTVVVSIAAIASQIILWKNPRVITEIGAATKNVISAWAKLPSFTMLFLGAVILVKMVLQLSLFLVGYRFYAGDDFYRAIKADYWLQHVSFRPDWVAWLSLGSAWLPFPDYLFGLGLALHRDLYLTPKILNLFLSSVAVVVAYFLGRRMFGRAAGLFTAILCAFQPSIIWLGISGMTSDILSMVTIALFGLFLFRWLETNQSVSLIAAAGCLFVAAAIRYENWFFSVVFSLFLVYRFISDVRIGRLTGQAATVIVSALALANVFPLFHMAASYYLFGDLIPAMQQTGSFRTIPTPKINMILLALSAFPLEIVLTLGGIALILRSDGAKSSRVYVLEVVTTFLLFFVVFKGQLPLYGFGQQRILLPYVILLLPYAGFLLARLLRTGFRQPLPMVATCLLLLTIGTVDILRAFNFNRPDNNNAFAAGWTLRILQQLGDISDNERILIEKEEGEIIALANKPERFTRLDEIRSLKEACDSSFQTPACKNQLSDGTFNVIILSSAEKVRAFQEGFSGRSWQIGNYHIYEVNPPSKELRSHR